MLSLGAIVDRFLTFSLLPIATFREKFLFTRQVKDNPDLHDLFIDGVLNLSDILPSSARHDLESWADELSFSYSRNTNGKTVRHYNVHLEHPVPLLPLKHLSKILNVYFDYSPWIVDQTQWQISFPSPNSLPGQGFHVDAFYPSLKLFIYNGPVNALNGPMLYIKGSHRWPKNIFKRALWSLFRSLRLTYFPQVDINKASTLLSENPYSFFLCDMRLFHSSSRLEFGTRTVTVINFRKRYVFM
ncbi:hypothetical protein [Synechococcus sp. UW179A]|uniref:hypothetical protein n=1 Tax=Synechococcus sp. UW179A TaxID=2575510 RepID=UPI0010BEACB2|nr:hypothetical protein [Synechococcus sp. UW179A]